MPGVRETYLKVGRHRLRTVTAGAAGAPAVLLMHGIGVSSRYFAPLIRELADTCRVVAFDLPGFGTSSRPDRTLNLDELADVTAGVIRALGLERPLVVGHSMGGQLAVKLALRHPGLVQRAVLIGPTVNVVERAWWWQALRLMQDGWREPWGFNALMVVDYMRCGVPRYMRTLRYMLADDIEDQVARAPVELLILRGERDPIARHQWAARLAASAWRGRLVEVPGAPHGAQWAAAREVAALCRDFMKR